MPDDRRRSAAQSTRTKREAERERIREWRRRNGEEGRAREAKYERDRYAAKKLLGQ